MPVFLAPEAGPATLKPRPWAGDKLARLRGRPPSPRIGESWEFSTLPGSESRSGGEALRDRLGHELPFLAKLIDTSLPLSVQVHPDDGEVDEQGSPTLGKEEAWVVLEAEPGAELLVGVRDGVDAPALAAATRLAVVDPTRESALVALLRPIPALPGTVIVVPAGTVHAIGPGILLAELQQPTDRTYRLYDYGSQREIHSERALATVKVDSHPLTWTPAQPPTTLLGKHLELLILGVGAHRLPAWEGERLLVPALAGAHLSSRDGEEELRCGDLRLALGPAFELDIARDGLAVVGWIRS